MPKDPWPGADFEFKIGLIWCNNISYLNIGKPMISDSVARSFRDLQQTQSYDWVNMVSDRIICLN